MKKKQITFDKKLSLDRNTIAKLNVEQMNEVQGGGSNDKTCTGTCNAAEALELEISCKACSCN